MAEDRTITDSEYITALNRDLMIANAQRADAVEALQEIAGADPVDMALDPTWSQRIARAALEAADA